jgi:NTP pyrophosphatase (non-canonical NTP hydrolase)
MSIFEETYQVWGVSAQIHKFSEELFELGVAMHHWYEDKATNDDLAEEIADVEIACAQLRNLIGTELVDEYKLEKMKRLRKRVDECLEKKKQLIVQETL